MRLPYRLAIYLKWQIGLLIGLEDGFIVIDILFLKIMVNITKGGKGFNLYETYVKNKI